MDRAAPICVIGGANIDISAKYTAPVSATGESLITGRFPHLQAV